MVLKVVGEIIWKFTKENPQYFFINLIFLVVSVANYVYLPMLYGYMIDTFKEHPSQFLTLFAHILILKGIVYMLFQVEDFYSDKQKNKIQEYIQDLIVERITQKYEKTPEDVIVGEKIASLLKVQTIITTWWSRTREYLIPYIIAFIFIGIYLAKFDTLLGLSVIPLLLGTFIMILTNNYICAEQGKTTNKAYLDIYQEVEDHLSNLITIITYGQVEKERERLDKKQRIYQHYYMENERCTLKWRMLGVGIISVVVYLIMLRAYKLMGKKVMDNKTFFGVYFVIIGLLGKMIFIGDIFHNISTDYGNLKELEEINIEHDHGNNPTDVPRGIKINTQSLIKINNITFQHAKSNQPTIKNLSLDIKKGERVALVGDIGCGKSTLLKLILGLYKPTSGQLFFNGYSYQSWEKTKLFKNFGYMTQNPILFNRSIVDNIIFSNPNTTREEVITLLEKFNLNEVFSKLEKGIDTPVGKNGSKLSGGQKQIVWFLRIYLNNPDILLLDEPTASLSKESKTTLWELIKKGFGDKTIIVASHDDFLIKMTNRKVRM